MNELGHSILSTWNALIRIISFVGMTMDSLSTRRSAALLDGAHTKILESGWYFHVCLINSTKVLVFPVPIFASPLEIPPPKPGGPNMMYGIALLECWAN